MKDMPNSPGAYIQTLEELISHTKSILPTVVTMNNWSDASYCLYHGSYGYKLRRIAKYTWDLMNRSNGSHNLH